MKRFLIIIGILLFIFSFELFSQERNTNDKTSGIKNMLILSDSLLKRQGIGKINSSAFDFAEQLKNSDLSTYYIIALSFLQTHEFNEATYFLYLGDIKIEYVKNAGMNLNPKYLDTLNQYREILNKTLIIYKNQSLENDIAIKKEALKTFSKQGEKYSGQVDNKEIFDKIRSKYELEIKDLQDNPEKYKKIYSDVMNFFKSAIENK